MNLPRVHAACAASKTELIVCGGCTRETYPDNVKDVEVYHPETDKYVNLAAPEFKLFDLNCMDSLFMPSTMLHNSRFY